MEVNSKNNQYNPYLHKKEPLKYNIIPDTSAVQLTHIKGHSEAIHLHTLCYHS